MCLCSQRGGKSLGFSSSFLFRFVWLRSVVQPCKLFWLIGILLGREEAEVAKSPLTLRVNLQEGYYSA